MRLTVKDLARARSKDRLLPLLLCTLRDENSALRELRWIRQEITSPDRVRRACIRRGVFSEPLQYILGTQPFGAMDILCRREVLIPRWETEEWCLELAKTLQRWKEGLTMVDFCTGTGCIPLALASARHNKGDVFVGADVSERALSCFGQNIEFNKRHLGESTVRKTWCNVMAESNEVMKRIGLTSCDLVTANPPYVLQDDYYAQTERSVRIHEPKLALLGDKEFYTAILHHAKQLCAKGAVFEVGNLDQALHVCDLGTQLGWEKTMYKKDANGKIRTAFVWSGDILDGYSK